MDGKKLLKYSQGLKDKSIQIKDNLVSSIRNKGSGQFFVGNFTLPSSSIKQTEAGNDDDVLDTFVRLDGFGKVRKNLILLDCTVNRQQVLCPTFFYLIVIMILKNFQPSSHIHSFL